MDNFDIHEFFFNHRIKESEGTPVWEQPFENINVEEYDPQDVKKFLYKRIAMLSGQYDSHTGKVDGNLDLINHVYHQLRHEEDMNFEDITDESIEAAIGFSEDVYGPDY